MSTQFVTHYLHCSNNLAVPVERLLFTAAQVSTTGDQLTSDGVAITTARRLIDVWNKQYIQYGVTNYMYSLDVPAAIEIQGKVTEQVNVPLRLTIADIHTIADFVASAWDVGSLDVYKLDANRRRQFELSCRVHAIVRYDQTYTMVTNELAGVV